jgi:hypothetical protein
MANQPRPGNPARAVRVEDELWDAAMVIATERGETLSDIMRDALRRYVKRYRVIPPDPCIAPPGNLCTDTGCWDADRCVVTRPIPPGQDRTDD